MADCRACGAPIRWAEADVARGKIALDVHETNTGPDRWRLQERESGARPIATPVTSDVLAFAAHRTTCPYNVP